MCTLFSLDRVKILYTTYKRFENIITNFFNHNIEISIYLGVKKNCLRYTRWANICYCMMLEFGMQLRNGSKLTLPKNIRQNNKFLLCYGT